MLVTTVFINTPKRNVEGCTGLYVFMKATVEQYLIKINWADFEKIVILMSANLKFWVIEEMGVGGGGNVA